MQKHTKSVVALLLAVIVISCGCSAQKTLASRLSEADRLIVLNPSNGATMTVKDEELRKLLQALAASKKIPRGADATPSYTLVFYKGAVHLATVPTGAEIIFFIDKTPYEDKSGTLGELLKKLWAKQARG